MLLVEGGECAGNQFVLEGEGHLDLDARAGLDGFLLAVGEIGEVHVHLGARERDELAEGPDYVPAPFVDPGIQVDVLRERVVLEAVLDRLHGARAESKPNDGKHKRDHGGAAAASRLGVILKDFHLNIINVL